MRFIFLLSIILSSYSILNGQSIGNYQTSTILKEENVKIRRSFKGRNRKLVYTNYYDQNGRLIRHQIIKNAGAIDISTHYHYDNEGKLLNQIDSIKTGLPVSPQVRKLLYGVRRKHKVPAKPTVDVAQYELTYDGDQLSEKKRFDQNGILIEKTSYLYNGRIQDVEQFKENKLIHKSTSKYIDDFFKDKYSGWSSDINGKKRKWDYKYTYEFEEGKVKVATRLEGVVFKEKKEFFYNEDGLLVRISGLSPEYFEYEYY